MLPTKFLRWRPPLHAHVLAAILSAGALWQSYAGRSDASAWRYDRASVAAGEWWRLVTGQLVHHDLPHAVLNGVGFATLWCLYVRDGRPSEWLAVCIGALTGVALGLWWLEPQTQWYVGASGMLHGLWAGGAVLAWTRSSFESVVSLSVLCLKLCWEQFAGPLSTLVLTSTFLVVTPAHLFGAVAGATTAVVAMILRYRRTASSL